MPRGDFPGYAAQVQYVRDSLLHLGRVPLWCVECYGGTTNFTGHLKEYLAFPLALVFDAVVATKLAFLILKIAAGWGLYALAARYLAAPAAGIIAGYALAFSAIANNQVEHLEIALGSALIPPLAATSVELLRRGGIGWTVALGVLAACALVNNWVYAVSVPAVVIALAASRAGLTEQASPWRDRRTAARWARRVGAALGVFVLFAGSQIAWIAFDTENHRLLPPEQIAGARGLLVERSPFLFVNRDNVLTPWLEMHHPPGFDLAVVDRDYRYLGWVCLAVCAIGALALHRSRDEPLRRWAAVASSMFWLQYWLSLGPRTLLWEIASSLHWTPATEQAVRIGLLVASSLALVLAAALAYRSLRSAGARWNRARWALLASALFCFPIASLWSASARVLPALAVQRSPGHFFDLAPVWLYLLFAVALVAIARSVARPRAATALLAAVAAAVVLDFAPSRRRFSEGIPMPELDPFATALASLSGEHGTLRIGLQIDLPIDHGQLASWLIAQSSLGHAWGWLFWQANRSWEDLIRGSLYVHSRADAGGQWPVVPEAALLRAARVRYLLLDAGQPKLPDPWRLIAASEHFALWDQGEDPPIAQGYRRYAALPERRGAVQAYLVSQMLQANVLAISMSGPPASLGLEPSANAGSPGDLRSEGSPGAAPPVAATVHRPKPEQITVEIDAGHEPAVVSISESHHPWWRARVDGERAPVLRGNLATLAVPVGRGPHRIELWLERPPLVAFADGVTAAAWVALGIGLPTAALLRSRLRRWRRPQAAPPPRAGPLS